MTYNFSSGAIRWQMPYSISHGNSNVCSISHRLRDIRKSRKNAKTLTLKMKIAERDLRHSTRNARIHIDDFFLEFHLPGNIRLRKRIHTRTQRQV